MYIYIGVYIFLFLLMCAAIRREAKVANSKSNRNQSPKWPHKLYKYKKCRVMQRQISQKEKRECQVL